MDLKDFLLKWFKNISWKNKYIRLLFRFLDLPDWVIRQFNGLAYLPQYSIRVRSTGIEGQLGGKQLVEWGETVADLLVNHAALRPDQRVLEIGCGCGSAAFALTKRLQDETYTGIDIDKQSVLSCKRNARFVRKQFRFEWMNLYHPMYNPKGKIPVQSYRFPYQDKTFDLIFLISVFTHMLPDDVLNYVREIGRMLRPGGKCFLTTFLVDLGFDGFIDFPFDRGNYRLHQELVPEKAVGYHQLFLEQNFNQYRMHLIEKPLLGQWRKNAGNHPIIEFVQDVLIFAKQ